MEKIRLHLETNTDRAVSLSELSRLTGLSPTTVEKQFKAAMGSSPLAYQRALRARKLRVHLKEERSVTDAIYAAGFSSSSRVYEDTALGMTPLRFAQGGRGERIGMGTAETSSDGWWWELHNAVCAGSRWPAASKKQKGPCVWSSLQQKSHGILL
jgi:AraC family transcriptional regulator of adaptative response/methylated-DNA-[protein]-cysteine methyltransferase